MKLALSESSNIGSSGFRDEEDSEDFSDDRRSENDDDDNDDDEIGTNKETHMSEKKTKIQKTKKKGNKILKITIYELNTTTFLYEEA